MLKAKTKRGDTVYIPIENISFIELDSVYDNIIIELKKGTRLFVNKNKELLNYLEDTKTF